MMSADQLFGSDPLIRKYARELYEAVENLPIISPHGHVPPVLFEDETYRFVSPAELFVIPDHYICLLYTSPSPRDRTRSRMPSSA